jgi:hypothetical protein
VSHTLALSPSSHQSFLIDILEHVPRRRVEFGIIVGVGVFPIGCQSTPVVEIIRMEQFAALIFVIVEISIYGVIYGVNVDASFCLCIAEVVSSLLLHIKRTNSVFAGVEHSLRQEDLS